MSESVPPLPAAATTPPPRRRWVKWAVGAGVVIVAVVASLPWLLSTSWMREVIHGWLRENVDRPVAFSSLDLSWTEGLRLHDLVVHEERDGDPPLLEAPLVVLKMPLLPALFRDFRVESLEIRDPVVRIVRRRDGDTNADALRTRRRRRPESQGEGAEDAADAPEEPTAFPEIRVPVEVRNLTLVFRDPDGREARKSGIAFHGDLTTRDGPTTFSLDVPDGATGGSLRVEGSARLFDAEGFLLPADRRALKAGVVARSIDAASNRDVLGLFTDSAPTAGILDATADLETEGTAGRGSFDVRLRGVSATSGAAREPGAEDLTAAGRFDVGDGRVKVEGLRVRAEGLSVDADVGGPTRDLRGTARLSADLARATAALRSMGWDFGGSLAGTIEGSVEFAPPASAGAPATARGSFVATGLRASGVVADRPPVEIGRATLEFTGTRGAEDLRVDASVSLPAMTLRVGGTVADAGKWDLAGAAQGDLGDLLRRIRDLGLLPAGLSVNGTLDTKFAVRGTPGRPGADALTVHVERLVLAEEDLKIEAGGRASSESIAFSAKGDGDLGRLLRRASAGGPSESEPLSGRFSFEAEAAGSPRSPAIRVPRLRLTGDFDLDAAGELGADGSLDARAHAEGSLPNAFAVLRRLGLVPEGVSLDGTIRADAVVAGTRDRPQVPSFSVALAGDDVTLDAAGTVAADRKLSATAKGAIDLGRVTAMLRRSGTASSVPPLTGRLTFDAEAAGTTDNASLPRLSLALRDGPFEAEVTGSVATSGRVGGKVTAKGTLASLARLAKDGGWAPELTPSGTFALDATVGGTRNQVQLPSAELRVEGPVTATVRAAYDPAEIVRVTADVRGALQPLLDLAAQWNGTSPRKLDGSVEATLSAEGPRSRLLLVAPRVTVRAAGLVVDASGSRDADGNLEGRMVARGGLPELRDVLGSFGFSAGFDGTGTFDATVEGSRRGDVVEGAASAVVTDLRLGDPEVPSSVFHEPRIVLTIPRSRLDAAAGRIEPVACTLESDGARLDVRAGLRPGPAAEDGRTPRVVAAEGRIVLEESFSARHAARFGDTTFRRIDGAFRFEGDVGAGRAAAAGWTGGAEIAVTSLQAPHVAVETARTVARIAEGAVRFDPIEGKVNGGTLAGTASIGLVGEQPEHALDVTATDVAIDADLAPLVAHASPLFALGEEGTAGGSASLDLHLTARGLDRASVERTLAGRGEIRLKDSYVESSRLLGSIFTLLGGSGRMAFTPARVPFTVADGKVRTSDLSMEGAGIAMKLAGDVGLDGKIAYGFRVRPLRSVSAFDRYAKLLDPDGYLPLRLEGRLSNPKLRAPDVKDLLKGEVESLLGGLLGKKDEKDADPPPAEKPGGRKKKRRPPPEEEPPPPPPPPPRNKK